MSIYPNVTEQDMVNLAKLAEQQKKKQMPLNRNFFVLYVIEMPSFSTIQYYRVQF